MTITFVSRHQGAIDWAREEGLLPEQARIVDDFDVRTSAAGDLVIGTLPAQLAASICERGARYQHLTLDLTSELRGKDLDAAGMRACNARLEEFFIQRSTVTPGKTRQTAHLCLVSDQSLQNILPARLESHKPDLVFLLQSATMKDKSADLRLKKALDLIGCKKVSTINDCPDHDLPQIIAWGSALIHRLRTEHPQTRFIANLTGGNKLMSTGLFQALRPWCEVIYCDTEHHRLEILHPPGQTAVELPADLINIKIYLAAQGFIARDSEVDGRLVDARSELTCWLAENAGGLNEFIGNLNGAAAYWEANTRTNRTDTPNLRSCTGELAISARQRLLDAGMLENTSGQISVVKDHADYLRGGWLEEYCYAIGRELEKSDDPAHRVTRARFGINVKIDPIDATRPGKYPLNELDAAFVHHNRMLIVECKTGAQLREEGKSQTILNKLEVLGEHAAGRFARKFVLTTETTIDNATAERAKRYGISILTGRELIKLKQHIIDWMNS